MDTTFDWESQLDREINKWLRRNSAEWWDDLFTKHGEQIRIIDSTSRANHTTTIRMTHNYNQWFYTLVCSSCLTLTAVGFEPGADSYLRSVAKAHSDQHANAAIKEFIRSVK